MLYIKSFMHKISFKKQTLFLFLFILFKLMDVILSTYDFFDGLIYIFPVVFIGLAVMYLQFDQKPLGAHVLMLFGLFGQYLYAFTSDIFSFNFGTMSFMSTINHIDAIGSVLSIYLIIFVISALMNERFSGYKMAYDPLVVLFAIYLYIRFGFEYAVLNVSIACFLMFIRSKVAFYLWVISFVISMPFFLIDLIIEQAGYEILSYWVYEILGLILLVFGFIKLIKALNEKEA
ncbi:hypothetical protein BK011_06875 [Tenericutes bacterium MZ-XQ]|nr:hypothetical protein BK011_06875 [Tenericutes bacterium MZ-XQ]